MVFSRDILPVLVAIIVALLGTVVPRMMGAKKDKADAADKLTEIAVRLVKPLEERITTLEQEQVQFRRTVVKYTEYISYLVRGINMLLKQMDDHSITPVWTPEPMDTSNDKV